MSNDHGYSEPYPDEAPMTAPGKAPSPSQWAMERLEAAHDRFRSSSSFNQADWLLLGEVVDAARAAGQRETIEAAATWVEGMLASLEVGAKNDESVGDTRGAKRWRMIAKEVSLWPVNIRALSPDAEWRKHVSALPAAKGGT